MADKTALAEEKVALESEDTATEEANANAEVDAVDNAVA